MAKKKFRRKQYIIKPLFQLKISFIIVMTLLLATLITAASLYFSILNSVLPEFSSDKLKQRIEIAADMRMRQVARYSSEIEGSKEFEMFFPETAKMLSDYETQIVVQVLHEVNKNLVPWIMVLIALILSFGIFLTHRVAGPIYRFEQTIKTAMEGNLNTRIKLRWADEFKHLASSINDMLNSFSQRLIKLKKSSEKLESIAAQMESQAAGSSKELKELILENQKQANEIKKVLDYYESIK
jgi:methyl-accepting chemotaxis protein